MLNGSSPSLFPRLFLALFAAVASAAAGAASVTADLDRTSIMAGESTALRVIIEGSAPQGISPLPSIPGLRIQFSGRGQELRSVNGRSTIRHILNFTVTSSEPGQYAIPSIQVQVDGETHSTQPVTLTVTPADPNAGNRNAFVRLTVPSREIYVGEVFPIEIQLYVAGRGEDLQPPELKSDGFVLHQQAPHKQFNTQIGRVNYNVVSFRMSISAAKAGTLQLGPARVSFTLYLPNQRNTRDPFGFFGTRYQRRPVTLESEVHEMKVLPLPAGAPASFAGAIGQFQWRVQAGPTNLAAGDPITLKATVAGRGNWDSVKLPAIAWPGFKSYPPTASLETSDPLGIAGSKRFEQVIIPEHAGLSEIPPLEFAFFDPEAKDYRTLSAPATPIAIRPGGGPRVQPQLANPPEGADEPEAPSGIVHIKPEAGPLLAMQPPLVARPWFLPLQLLPVLGFAAAWAWRKHQERLANNPRLRRRLETRRLVEHGLRDLRRECEAGEVEPFYAAIFRLLQEQLGERLDLPASAITESSVDARLPALGASDDLRARLHELFQVCNQARYAPAGARADMAALIPKLQRAIHELQQLPG